MTEPPLEFRDNQRSVDAKGGQHKLGCLWGLYQLSYLLDRVGIMNLRAKRNEASQELVGDTARSEIGSPEQRGMNSKDIPDSVSDPFSFAVLQPVLGDSCLIDSSYGLLRVGQALLKRGPSSKSKPYGKFRDHVKVRH